MPLLEAGSPAVEIPLVRWTEQAPATTGEKRRTFDNSLRSSIRSRKQRFQGVTRELTPTEYTNIRAEIEGTQPVTVGGDLMTAESITSAEMEMLGVATSMDGAVIMRQITFLLEEV